MTIAGYDIAALPERCEEALCPRCDTPLFGSASLSPWCPDCDTAWPWDEARCPYPATATSFEGERLCRVHAPLTDHARLDADELASET